MTEHKDVTACRRFLCVYDGLAQDITEFSRNTTTPLNSGRFKGGIGASRSENIFCNIQMKTQVL